jgi:quinol monooxygenase YgiN
LRLGFVPSREEKGRLIQEILDRVGTQIETSVALADSKEPTSFFPRPIRFNYWNRLHGVSTESNAFWRRIFMNTTMTVTKEVTTLIHILTVEPENQPKLIELLRANTEKVVSTLDGWISTNFIAAKDQRHVVIYSQWRNLASVEAMRANPDMVAYFPRIAALAAFDGFAGDVVYTRHA